jgi:YHS domain-containing protein
MSTFTRRLAIALAAALVPGLAWAQHEAHQPASPQASSPELTQCLRVQPVIQNIIAAATSRAEAARLSNSPAEMRAAVESLEAALRDIRVQSAPCSTAAVSSDPHAGHTMPTTQSPASTQPAQPPSAADPHAVHTMPRPAPSPKSAGPSKPTTAKPEASKAADPYAGHSAVHPADKQMDPVNGLMVDPATAPKTTYQGHTYYFSSEQSRKEFLENPAKFAKKPKR